MNEKTPNQEASPTGDLRALDGKLPKVVAANTPMASTNLFHLCLLLTSTLLRQRGSNAMAARIVGIRADNSSVNF
jgi:hypothetical protein